MESNALRDSSEINRIVVRNYGEHRQSTQSFFPFAPILRYIRVILHRVMELSHPFDCNVLFRQIMATFVHDNDMKPKYTYISD